MADDWNTDVDAAPRDRFIFLWCPEDGSRWMASWQGERWHGVDDLGLAGIVNIAMGVIKLMK